MPPPCFADANQFNKKATVMITTTLPLKIISVANARLNRFKLAAMNKAQRQTTKHTMQALALPPAPPMTIVLTRIGPKTLDTDNLAGGFKAARDGVADWLGVDDGHPGLDWQYAQRCAGPKVYSVEIEVIAAKDTNKEAK